MKKLLFLLALCLGSLASWAQNTNDYFSAVAPTGQTLYCIRQGSYVTVTHPNQGRTDPWGSYTKPTGNLTIPSSVTYDGFNYSVTSIGEYAFYECTDLTNVTIPYSVTSIGGQAFFGCEGLTHLIVPNLVTSIGEYAFDAIDTIYYSGSASGSTWRADTVITDNYTEAGDPLVYESPYKTMVVGCDPAATSVTIPNTVTTIGSLAFLGCPLLTYVTIPNSVTTFYRDSFTGLRTVFYCGEAWLDFMGAYHVGCFHKDGDFVFEDDTKTTLVSYIGTGENVTIPSTVTTIGDYAFFGSTGIISVIVRSSVTTIGTLAFDGVGTVIYCGEAEDTHWGAEQTVCFPIEGDFVFEDDAKTNLIGYIGAEGSVTIPSTVTTIAERAFQNCSTLTSLTIPNSVTTIEDYAFSGCTGLQMVSIGEAVTQIGDNAFEDCTNVDTMYYNAINLGGTAYWSHENYGFKPMQFNTLVIGNKVQSLPEDVFEKQFNITSVTLPNSVKNIGNGVFDNCENLSQVTLGDSVTSIGMRAFANCNFTDITLPNLLTNIDRWAFRGCSFTSLTLPNSLTTIGDEAFSSCENLTNVTFGNSLTTIGEEAFMSCPNLDNVTIPSSVETIGENAFYDGVKTVLYCGDATGAPWGAQKVYGALQDSLYFANCDKTIVSGYVEGLTNATIPSSVTTIASNVFKNCTTLTSVTIPPSMTSIENHAFEGCTNVTTLNYNAKNLTTTSDWYNTSDDCNTYGFRPMSPQTLVIGDSVETLPAGVFYGQSGITAVTIPSSVTNLGRNAFQNCSSLASATIGNSVTNIKLNTFDGCSSLVSLTIPNSVTSIGSYAFYHCSGLTSLTIPNSVTKIWDYAYDGCTNLKTIYNLSGLNIVKGDSENGYVAKNALRVLSADNGGFSNYGAGENTLHQISTDYLSVDAEDNDPAHIPVSTIPANFLYLDGGNAKSAGGWRANEIVLADGQDAFEAPEAFTADTATYSRSFTNGNRSTLYLPFTAAIPDGFEVYAFSGFDNSTIYFAAQEDSVRAYTPYLVGYDLSKADRTTCTIGKRNAKFPKSESSSYHPVEHNGMTFSGVISRTEMTSTNNYGYSNGFFVQSGGHAHVNPFRCYFTYHPAAGAPQNLPATLFIDCSDNSPMGIGDVETPDRQNSIRYSNDVYDLMGRLVRSDAHSLEGLPTGIYIWQGKKLLHSKQ